MNGLSMEGVGDVVLALLISVNPALEHPDVSDWRLPLLVARGSPNLVQGNSVGPHFFPSDNNRPSKNTYEAIDGKVHSISTTPLPKSDLEHFIQHTTRHRACEHRMPTLSHRPLFP